MEWYPDFVKTYRKKHNFIYNKSVKMLLGCLAAF